MRNKAGSEKSALDRSEVALSGSIGSSGGGAVSRRKTQPNTGYRAGGGELKLTHLPTGISVTEQLEGAYYSRREMAAAEERLIEHLFRKLEDKVASHFKIPGR